MKTKELLERIWGMPLTACLTLFAIMFADCALAGSLSSILNADTAHFSYNSSTETYTLLADQTIKNDFSVSDKNYKFDLNGHRLKLSYDNDGGTIRTGSYAIEFQNSTSTIGIIELQQITGRVIIGKNVKFADYFIRGRLATLEVQTGGMISSSMIVYDDTLLSEASGTDIGNYASVGFSAESQLVLQPGVKISQQGLENDVDYKYYMGPEAIPEIKSYYGVYWGGWVDMTRKFVPEGCTLEGPDADGYYTVTKPAQDVVVSEAEGDLAIDTRTEPRTITTRSTETFTHSVSAWGEAAAQSTATITYKLNGGAAQTLGSYADDATATWTPTKSGEYLFTHTPGSGITARFFVNLPYDGSGTAEDPYLVGNTAAFNEVAAKGGYVTLLGDIAASASVPSGKTVVIDVDGKVLSGSIANEGDITVYDSNGSHKGDFTATVTGSGKLTDNIVRETATIQVLAAQQRYPWNGLVDVAYETTGILAEKQYSAIFSVTVEGVGTKTFMVTNVVEGTNKTVWDAAAPSAFGTVVTNKIASITAVLYCETQKSDLETR